MKPLLHWGQSLADARGKSAVLSSLLMKYRALISNTPGLVKELGIFWNNIASWQDNVFLVICGFGLPRG